MPWKLAAQVAMMRRHPEIGMVWTDMMAIDEWGLLLHETYLRRMYTSYDRVRIEENEGASAS